MRRLLVTVSVFALACGSSTRSPRTRPDKGPFDAGAEVHSAFANTTCATEGHGMITGTVVDTTGAPIVGLSTVVTSPSFEGEKVQLTDDAGAFVHSNLTPGPYKVTYFYATTKFEHASEVVAGKVTRITIVKWHQGPTGELL